MIPQDVKRRWRCGHVSESVISYYWDCSRPFNPCIVFCTDGMWRLDRCEQVEGCNSRFLTLFAPFRSSPKALNFAQTLLFISTETTTDYILPTSCSPTRPNDRCRRLERTKRQPLNCPRPQRILNRTRRRPRNRNTSGVAVVAIRLIYTHLLPRENTRHQRLLDTKTS